MAFDLLAIRSCMELDQSQLVCERLLGIMAFREAPFSAHIVARLLRESRVQLDNRLIFLELEGTIHAFASLDSRLEKIPGYTHDGMAEGSQVQHTMLHVRYPTGLVHGFQLATQITTQAAAAVFRGSGESPKHRANIAGG